MRSHKLFATTVLLLGLSTASWAAPAPADRYRDRYPDRNYGGDRVSSIAREIENTAAIIQREFDRNNRRPDRNEARVSAALQDLRAEADRFHRQTAGYRDSRYGGRGVDGLYRAFDRASDSLRYIERRGYVDRGMDRIWSLLSDLDGSRGGRGRYDDRGGWRDRRDGRDGRYDRYDNRY